ncbi:hypothetical protein BH09ACT5_BH09ACT5_24380 [soil metagenome]
MISEEDAALVRLTDEEYLAWVASLVEPPSFRKAFRADPRHLVLGLLVAGVLILITVAAPKGEPAAPCVTSAPAGSTPAHISIEGAHCAK